MEPFQEIVHGITRRLREEFQLPVYAEEVEQELKSPCFLVIGITKEITPALVPRYRARGFFDVLYFPAQPDKQRECLEISGRLFWALEEITAGGFPVRAEKPQSRVVDGVLHFTAGYTIFIRKETLPPEQMAILELKEGIG